MPRKTPIPNESGDKPELTFEQAMKIIANAPKEVVDGKIKQTKKRKKKRG